MFAFIKRISFLLDTKVSRLGKFRINSNGLFSVQSKKYNRGKSRISFNLLFTQYKLNNNGNTGISANLLFLQYK